ncbi:hypothetical protein DKT75_04275 [Leucothrix arctica]|uniref:Uncharacterized protein n=2 Tax=Leucothrix arctica TaxID=1481894 RepID=A0A317CJI6_9GAMM|nr:hypothetical protein DKT75_04275 [Leucothrix arctica]
MLSLMMLMTPWLSFWTSPHLISNNANQYLLVCTINGIEKRSISTLSDQVVNWQTHCSALQLADILSHSALPTVETIILSKLPSEDQNRLSFYQHTVPHISAYTSRAPPYL